jgi:phage terminase large subunit GpA-like protein
VACDAARGVWPSGFRLNALVSLLSNARWGRLAAEFLNCRKDPAELQVFVNTILGEAYQTPSMIDENSLAARAEAFDLNNIPGEVLTLTVGVDTQDDRLEASVLGFTKDQECLVLGHIIIWGSYLEGETWRELDKLLRSRWRHPFGGTLSIDAAIVDAGDGEHFQTVLGFCIPRKNRRVFAGKGMAGRYPSFQAAKGTTIASRQVLVGVDTIKNAIFNRLQHGRGIRFSHTLEPNYFEQLASEHLVVRYVRGQPKRRFERLGARRAEALDCLVYGISARASYQLSFDQRETELRAAAPLPRQAPVGPPHVVPEEIDQRDDGQWQREELGPYGQRQPMVPSINDDKPSWLYPAGRQRSSFWDRE